MKPSSGFFAGHSWDFVWNPSLGVLCPEIPGSAKVTIGCASDMALKKDVLEWAAGRWVPPGIGGWETCPHGPCHGEIDDNRVILFWCTLVLNNSKCWEYLWLDEKTPYFVVCSWEIGKFAITHGYGSCQSVWVPFCRETGGLDNFQFM